jgi:uncharacterized membrane protein YkgB
MALTTYLAKLFGLYVALMGVVMIVKPRAMRELMAAFVDQRALLYLLGALRVLIGLAIVLGHNRWSGTLPTIVTLLAWITLVRGLAMLLVPPETERKMLACFQRSGPYYAAAIIAIVLGLWLAYAGFAG